MVRLSCANGSILALPAGLRCLIRPSVAFQARSYANGGESISISRASGKVRRESNCVGRPLLIFNGAWAMSVVVW